MLTSVDPTPFIHTADLVASRAFYVDQLGFGVVDESPYALVLRSGTTTIRVTPVEGHRPLDGTVLGWFVADLAGALDDLAARGVSLLRYDGMGQDDHGVWTAPSGARIAWFADPDGNTLSLTQE